MHPVPYHLPFQEKGLGTLALAVWLLGPRSPSPMVPLVPGSLALVYLFLVIVPGRCNRKGPNKKSPSEGDTIDKKSITNSMRRPRQSTAERTRVPGLQHCSSFYSLQGERGEGQHITLLIRSSCSLVFCLYCKYSTYTHFSIVNGGCRQMRTRIKQQ
jgi:hypothetical protein